MKLPRIPLRRQKLPKVVGKVLGPEGGQRARPLGLYSWQGSVCDSRHPFQPQSQDGEHDRAVMGTRGSPGLWRCSV